MRLATTQKALYSVCGYPVRVHGHDPVVEGGEAPLVPANELRLERSITITRYLREAVIVPV